MRYFQIEDRSRVLPVCDELLNRQVVTSIFVNVLLLLVLGERQHTHLRTIDITQTLFMCCSCNCAIHDIKRFMMLILSCRLFRTAMALQTACWTVQTSSTSFRSAKLFKCKWCDKVWTFSQEDVTEPCLNLKRIWDMMPARPAHDVAHTLRAHLQKVRICFQLFVYQW